MCGIAGLIHRGKSSNVGGEMTSMLQALKHRGPDSTGFAVYGESSPGDYVMRFKVAEAEDMASGYEIGGQIADRIAQIESRLGEHGATIKSRETATPYAMRYVISHSGDTEALARYIEDVEGAEILSLGNSLELIKDLGDATVVSNTSIDEIDGVFTYLVATADSLGMAKDTMAAKPLVLYESDDMIAMASEEVAIRAILPQEIDTYDPYDEEVRVWQA